MRLDTDEHYGKRMLAAFLLFFGALRLGFIFGMKLSGIVSKIPRIDYHNLGIYSGAISCLIGLWMLAGIHATTKQANESFVLPDDEAEWRKLLEVKKD